MLVVSERNAISVICSLIFANIFQRNIVTDNEEDSSDKLREQMMMRLRKEVITVTKTTHQRNTRNLHYTKGNAYKRKNCIAIVTLFFQTENSQFLSFSESKGKSIIS